ncbi:MAG TPA: glycosyltransferase family 2 protein [Acidimicrobiia bacterium]|nr:glycosyltransferase family 2 protein [Acidimicrobiia bacterium]
MSSSEPAARLTRWAAVVPTYNYGDVLEPSLRSMVAETSAGPPDLVVVDNASTDGSTDRLRVAMPEVRLLPAPGNVGYARAANLGIAATDAPIVAVLNGDLELHAGVAAAMLAAFAADARLGAVGPRMLNLDGSVYPSARSDPGLFVALGHAALGLVWKTNPWTRRYRQLDVDPTESRDVDWISGAAMWLRREALDDVGGWDERYFMYMEDFDLCLRLRRAGWHVRYEPAGEVVHVQGASTSKRPYRMIAEHHRSVWRFATRRYRGWRRILLVPLAPVLLVRCIAAMAQHAWGRPSMPKVTG